MGNAAQCSADTADMGTDTGFALQHEGANYKTSGTKLSVTFTFESFGWTAGGGGNHMNMLDVLKYFW